jgi:hypothetical protein
LATDIVLPRRFLLHPASICSLPPCSKAQVEASRGRSAGVNRAAWHCARLPDPDDLGRNRAPQLEITAARASASYRSSGPYPDANSIVASFLHHGRPPFPNAWWRLSITEDACWSLCIRCSTYGTWP